MLFQKKIHELRLQTTHDLLRPQLDATPLYAYIDISPSFYDSMRECPFPSIILRTSAAPVSALAFALASECTEDGDVHRECTRARAVYMYVKCIDQV